MLRELHRKRAPEGKGGGRDAIAAATADVQPVRGAKGR